MGAYVVACVECGEVAKLVDGKISHPGNPLFAFRKIYLCSCGAFCGCISGTDLALGLPGNELTRLARLEARMLFEPLWTGGQMTRAEAYRWLAAAMEMPRGQCHINTMTGDQARKVCDLVRQHHPNNALT